MADGDTTAPGGVDMDQLNALVQQLSTPPQPQQQPQQPRQGGVFGALGLLGEALGGGETPLYQFSPQEAQAAGGRALLNFGLNMMAQSGPSPWRKNLGQIFASGLQGAEQSMQASEEQGYTALGQRQAFQQQQLTNRLEALKAALPILQYQWGAKSAADALKAATGGTGTGTTSIAGVTPGTYVGAIAGHEGTGANPNSSAAGVGQFLEGTWNQFAQANPDLFKGMTPQQILAARSNPVLGAKAIDWLAQQNAGVLQKAGITPSGQSLGISHYIGAGATAKLMAAPDNAPVAGFVSPAAVKANPELGTMTVGQLKARYAGTPNPTWMGGPTAVAAATPPGVTTPPRPAVPPTLAAGAPATATPTAPGVPPSPYAAPGAATTAYTGGGIGSALNPQLPVPPVPPAMAVKGSPIPAGKLMTTGKPPGVADIIQQGIKTAQATPLVPGTVAAAGPAAGTPPPTVAAAPQPGWGTAIGAYGNAPATTAPPVVPTPQAPTQQPAPPPQPPTAGPLYPDIKSGDLTIRHPGDPTTFIQANVRLPPPLPIYSSQPTAEQMAEHQRNLAIAAASMASNPAEANKQIAAEGIRWAGVVTDKQNAADKAQAEWNAAETKRATDLYSAQADNYSKAQGAQHAANIDLLKSGAAADTKRNEALMSPYQTGAQNSQQLLDRLDLLKQVLPTLPQSGAYWLADEGNRAKLGALAQYLPESLTGSVEGADMFQQLTRGMLTSMGANLQSGAPGGREAFYEQAAGALPSLAQTSQGRETAVLLMQEMAKRRIAENQFLEDWAGSHKDPTTGVPNMSGAVKAMNGPGGLGAMPRLPPPGFNPEAVEKNPRAAAAFSKQFATLPVGGRFFGYTQGDDGHYHPTLMTKQPDPANPGKFIQVPD